MKRTSSIQPEKAEKATHRSYSREQHAIQQEFMKAYGFTADQIGFDGPSLEPIFDFDALSFLSLTLSNLPNLDVQFHDFRHDISLATSRVTVNLPARGERAMFAGAIIGELLHDGSEVDTLMKAVNLSRARALRIGLRAVNFDPVKAHREYQRSGQIVEFAISRKASARQREGRNPRPGARVGTDQAWPRRWRPHGLRARDRHVLLRHDFVEAAGRRGAYPTLNNSTFMVTSSRRRRARRLNTMLYPSDITTAANEWGANCGPCSLAALLDVPVAKVRTVINGFDKRKYMNPTHMKAALDVVGVEHRSLGSNLPERGLAFIQWGGHEKKPHFVQYQFTHWIAIEPGDGPAEIDPLPTVFEVNAPYLVTFDEWHRQMPDIARRGGLGNGSYFVRTGIEVSF